MSSDLVLTERSGASVLVTMNNPGTSNALDEEMGPRLSGVLEELALDDAVRALILTGSGGVFSAGGNLIKAHEHLESNPGRGGARVFARYTKWAARILAALTGMGKPVISAVEGAASGAGLAWLMASDLVVAAEDARIQPGFLAVGLVPAAGTTWHLPRLVGSLRAAEILMRNRPIPPAQALEMGLVHRVLPRERVLGAAWVLAQELAQAPALALSKTKAGLRSALGGGMLSHGEDERRAVLAAADDEDFRRLVRRFAARQD